MGVRYGVCVFVLGETPIITTVNVLGYKRSVKVNSNLPDRYLYPDDPYVLGESILSA